MSLDHWISLVSAIISFAGLLLVAGQLRASNKQQELESLIEIYDTNRELISLGFEHPKLFAILQDARNADPVWERRYLQLWMNQMSLIHSCLEHAVFNPELQDCLERCLNDFLLLENMQHHWAKYGQFYSASFQLRVNDRLPQKGSADSG